MAIVYLGLGSNLGDKESNINKAIDCIKGLKNTVLLKKSFFYVTNAVGGPEQDDFLNGVIKVQTDISPNDCLKAFKEIEKMLGRKDRALNYPREIDIDILFYDDRILESDNLVIPHPRLHERDFVLRGLNEVAPDLVHPLLGKTVRELYEVNNKN